MKLRINEISGINLAELKQALTQSADFVLEVPCPMVGFAQSFYSLAQDFLTALFVGENIAVFCFSVTSEEYRHGDSLSILLHMKPDVSEKLAEKLMWLSSGFDDDTSYGEGNDQFDEVHDAIAEFSFDLEQKVFFLPELADKYMLHWVLGLPEEHDADQLRRLDNPEHRFGYFKSFLSKKLGYDMYLSREAWIAPLDADIGKALNIHGGFSGELPAFEEAMYVAVDISQPILISSGSAVHFPQDRFWTAKKSAEDIWSEDAQYLVYGENDIPRFRISDTGNVLIIRDSIAQYILFRDSLIALSENEAKDYIQSLLNMEEHLREAVGEPAKLALPWDKISDDQFEELCYDIIRRFYTPRDARKMGNSRSRDGGRDIVFETTPRLGTKSVKWIAQCKLVKSGGSLS